MNGSASSGTGGGLNIKTKATAAITTTTTNPATTTNITNNNSEVGVIGGGVGANRLSKRRPQTQSSMEQQQQQKQTQQQQQQQQKIQSPSQYLKLTVHKDSSGYGMKVSGDNPVFVQSVTSGGAAHKAGLVPGDMILKVNDTEVRSEKHDTVCDLIKSHTIVEITVKRSQKMQRPTSVGITPSTPLLQRDRTASITGPQPVDNAMRKEMEFHKIKTLQLMLDQEKKNLENLKSSNSNNSNNRQDRARAEANIRKLQEQLRQVGGEDASLHYLTSSPTTIITPPTPTIHHHHHQQHHQLATTPQPQQSASPAFLSRFPRSLSSLSLGTRKNKDKDIITSPLNNLIIPPPPQQQKQHQQQQLPSQKSQDLLNIPSPPPPTQIPQMIPTTPLTHHQQHHTPPPQLPPPPPLSSSSSSSSNMTPVKKRFTGSERNLRDDIPPPLPQRHPALRNQQQIENDWRRNNIPVSDLDHSNSNVSSKSHHISSSGSGSGKSSSLSSSSNKNNKRSNKPKTKALSDPKMSTQMFLQMEKGGGIGGGGGGGNCNDFMDSSTPPPLPPRQPGMLEENQNMMNNSKMLSGNHNNNSRPLPNSIDTLMNYPLIATCTAVRDNMSAAFPLSQRPNIVQQLQQHQQQQQQQHHQQQQQQQQFHHYHHNLPSPHHHSSSSTSVNKSAALGQTPQQHMNHFNKHRRVVSSPEHMHPRHERHLDRHNKSSSGSWELMEKDNEATPPGTPPPPYLSSHLTQSQTIHTEDNENLFVDGTTMTNQMIGVGGGSPKQQQTTFQTNQILAAQPNTIQKEIISMEDEETSDQECIVDEHGPFNYLQRLLEPENVAHLAVFLNYVLSNSDPSPLLFYLITGLYKEGTAKDMRKWAYEIHSTFLVPFAPLLWFNIDESLAREVDNILQKEYDKVEILRTVFYKSRKKAREKICDQLREFQQKRTAGLGTIYGPSDQQLAEAKGDKNKEQKIFEETLLPKLQHLVDELDKEAPVECPKKLALCSALSTVLHRVFVTRSTPGSPIDRVHHFVSREKSFKSRLMGKSRKIVVRGHPLVLRQYYEVTHCNHCQTIIWGVSPQGYHCTDCKLNIHRSCSKVLEESCPGPVPQKRKEQHADNKISKFMEKIRPTHHFIQNERSRRMEEEVNADDFSHIDRPHSTSVVRQPSDRRPDLASTSFSSSGTASQNTSDLTTPSHGSFDTDSNALVATENDSKRDRSKSKSAPVSVNRSESYKERLSHKRNRTNRRKTSDPSLSKTNDEQSELGLSNANYTASSSSSLSSSSLESPSTSLEQVGGPQPTIPPGGQSQTGLSGPGPGSGGSASFQSNAMIQTATGTVPAPRQWVDSEDETDFTEIDWSSNLSTEVLASLSDAEKKRQEIINEIYQTERNHVRTLRLLEGLFLRPLQESGVLSNDHLQILFPPALFSLKELHSAFEQKLKHRRIEHGYIVRNVGDLLLEMFDGHSGDELRDYSAQFCLRQQIALESLKEKRRKDENLQRLLTKAESHKACRRLQLKDLLPTVMQRLTKYPLLFENLLKITKRVVPDDQNESDSIQKALDSSKQILSDVNQAVKIVEDAHKLQTIQRKLDKSGLDKDEFRNLDLTQYKLIHDGQLTMKKIPGVQLHGLLFENMMVLLHKQDDKYFLKYFPNLAAKTDENNKFISPITHFGQQTLVRQSAVDKNAFFLIITKTSQMLELRAPSSSECKKWFKHISDAAEQYKPRSKSSHDVVEDPASATLPHSNTKESLESTPERTTTTAATATATTTTVAAPPPPSNASATPSTGSTDNGIPNSHNQIKDRNDSFSNARNKIDDVNSRISTGTPAGADKFSSGVNGQIVTNVSSRKSNSINDERDKHHEGLRPDHDDNGRRDSVYSNNSNDTRTLMQICPLLEPSEIQISISPAPVAEPVVTPAERLKQLDQMIRERLAEKQKIICDMFRVPNEHFSEIADVAAQPEAPKDSADIALAAFAQVQSLIEVLNDHMKVTTVQEISAVSTAVCDQCHYRNIRTESSPMVSSIGSTNTGTTVIPNSELNQSNQSNNNTSGSGNVVMKDTSLDDTIIQEDDGYCEIDELRLPSVPNPLSNSLTTAIVNGLQQPQQQHKFAGPLTPVPPTPPPPPPPSVHISSSTPELIKRQSTISADSIPEETEQDITNDEQTSNSKSSVVSKADDESTSAVQSEATTSTDDQQLKGGLDDSLNNSEHMEINETYDSVTDTINKPQIPTPNQTQNTFGHIDLCGPNRLSHVQSLEPSVPCHLINGIVTTLGAQISLLLPKINERETERERLRRENQRLRELLNSMHENRRVAEEMETPDITESAKKDEQLIDQDNINQETSSAPSTTVVSSSTVTSAAATTAANVEKEN